MNRATEPFLLGLFFLVVVAGIAVFVLWGLLDDSRTLRRRNRMSEFMTEIGKIVSDLKRYRNDTSKAFNRMRSIGGHDRDRRLSDLNDRIELLNVLMAELDDLGNEINRLWQANLANNNDVSEDLEVVVQKFEKWKTKNEPKFRPRETTSGQD